MSTNVSKSLLEKINERTIHYFEEISKIPRASGKEQAAADYLVDFANKHGFSHRRTTDIINEKQTCSVIIYKPATTGYQDIEAFVLQAHIDMVCQKEPDSNHNFDTDPIELIIKGNIMTANKTTLGADNGVGVAIMLAILESNEIDHPPIEALFTSDEEDGMSGVKAITKDMLTGKRLINIDSEQEGVFTYGCAGGKMVDICIPITYEPVPEGYTLLQVDILGLVGGHSGVEIHEGRANSQLLLARTLRAIQLETSLRIASIVGGDRRNVIPRTASATICVPKDMTGTVKEIAHKMQDIFAREYLGVESGISIVLYPYNENNDDGKALDKCLNEESTSKVISSILIIPNDVLAMHSQVEGLVGTSCNLGLTILGEKTFSLMSHIRSFTSTKKDFAADQFRMVANILGAEYIGGAEYPNWEPNVDSPLLKQFKDVYESTFSDKSPRFKSIHAGLECGFISQIFPDMDMISCGPNIGGAHSPDEWVDLDSNKRIVELILNVLAKKE